MRQEERRPLKLAQDARAAFMARRSRLPAARGESL